MYSYVPAFPIVTDPDPPGLMAPVVHDPSRAVSVWTTFYVLVQVTAVPAVVRTRGGVTP
jgi:hypothetical protein